MIKLNQISKDGAESTPHMNFTNYQDAITNDNSSSRLTEHYGIRGGT